jgi:hypothetical protein
MSPLTPMVSRFGRGRGGGRGVGSGVGDAVGIGVWAARGRVGSSPHPAVVATSAASAIGTGRMGDDLMATRGRATGYVREPVAARARGER